MISVTRIRNIKSYPETLTMLCQLVVTPVRKLGYILKNIFSCDIFRMFISRKRKYEYIMCFRIKYSNLKYEFRISKEIRKLFYYNIRPQL